MIEKTARKTLKTLPEKISKLTGKDYSRINRFKWQLIEALKSLGNYLPDADDFYIEQIAKNRVILEKLDKYTENNLETFKTSTEARATLLRETRKLLEELAANRIKRLTWRLGELEKQFEELSQSNIEK